MAKVKVTSSSDNQTPTLPALTPEAQENQMIALTMNLVEQRLRNGSASSQETTHFLKLATVKYRLEKEKLRYENELTAAKTEAIKKTDESRLIAENAIKAMRSYQGQGDPDDYEDVY